MGSSWRIMKEIGRRKADFAILAALAAGRTVEEAARAANVSPTTVWRRRQDPTFCQRVDDLRAQALERAAAQLADAATAAVSCLRALLGANSEMARVQAARAILEYAVQYRSSVELERRVSELERLIDSEKIGRAT